MWHGARVENAELAWKGINEQAKKKKENGAEQNGEEKRAR
ncbi:hypothetical protein SLEP1_g58401 [Rubroshorea leprosula]|uniref:Uncharacterized protein n=1 Tax=Rubroshorea leprosula TaxID=152421 RepID=A0AAV5MST2_9ROSI|nr:hypothetical protein SLEP1_g58401 [Rubroshorea leprosula]